MSRWWSCSSRRVSSGSSQAFCRVVGKLFVEAQQFVVSEFFNIEVEAEFYNIEVVDEFFNIEVVDEVFVFAAIRLLLHGCRAPPHSSRLQDSRSVSVQF